MRLAQRAIGFNEADHETVGLADDFERDLLAIKPHRAAALAPHWTPDHLAGDLPLAFAEHVIDGGSGTRKPSCDLALRRARRKPARKFLRDKARGKLPLTPA